MKGLNIAVIGAGSTYTPELIEGFIRKRDSIKVAELRFMDIDDKKLEIVSGISNRMLKANGLDTRIKKTKDLDCAIESADFILGQVRVGGMEARISDEKIPLSHGLIGQETTGPGGFASALRTIPVMMDIARRIEDLVPEAWLINFSNPSGIIAQALLDHSKTKIIGLCNGPANMIRSIREMIPYEADNIDYEFVGLNHLCWITKLMINDIQIPIVELFDKDKDKLDIEMIEISGGYSSGYLNYYYFRERELDRLKKANKTRGEDCLEIENELLKIYMDPSVDSKPEVLSKRGGALYSDVAVKLIDSIANDKNDIHIVNVKNDNAYDFMDVDDVVEIKCLIDKHGAKPLKMTKFNNQFIKGLMKVVKSYEKLTIDAALTGDRNKAMAALMNHPLIGDHNKAKEVLDEILDANKKYLPQFF